MSEPFIGQIKMFAGNYAPRGYALCDGAILNPSQNTPLFSLLGTIYGGNGRFNFALPDLRGRVPIHQGDGRGLTPRRIGNAGGAATVSLTTDELSTHTHPFQASTVDGGSRTPANTVVSHTAEGNFYATTAPSVDMDSKAVEGTGGGQPHLNLMPYLAINFIIALTGTYPSRN